MTYRNESNLDNALDLHTAINICEGLEADRSESEVIAAWQYLIDQGIVWKLQGFYCRTARNLINAGVCRLARK